MMEIESINHETFDSREKAITEDKEYNQSQDVTMLNTDCDLSIETQMKMLEEQKGFLLSENGEYHSENKERLDRLVSEYRKIQKMSQGEIERKRGAVRSRCQERLWMAAVWRDYQLDIVKRSFDAEIKQIEREQQAEFNQLKESLMQELQEERKKLQALEHAQLTIDKTGNLSAVETQTSGSGAVTSDAATAAMLAAEEQAAVVSGRRLRKRDDKAGAVMNEATTSTTSNTGSTSNYPATNGVLNSRRKQANNIYTFNTLLQEQEILDDLGAIAKDAGSLGTSRRAATVAAAVKMADKSGTATSGKDSTLNVSFEKGSLHYNWDIISVNDRIKIQLNPSSGPVSAIVTACTLTEMSISFLNGRTNKVSIADLKSGKVIIFTDDLSNEN